MSGMNKRTRTLLGGTLGVLLVVSGVVAFAGVASAQKVSPKSTTTPTRDIVGIGLFNCAVVTGEIGFSPTTISSGSSTTTETVSIWFDATKCSAPSGAVAKPVPKTVIGSESFISNDGNLCPQLGSLGTGTLNLAYNFPPVPATIVDPSVGQAIGVTQSGGYWDLSGAINAGSYPSGNFTAALHPILVGAESCTSSTGVTSLWINHGTLTNA
jgi:hypothetical protein